MHDEPGWVRYWEAVGLDSVAAAVGCVLLPRSCVETLARHGSQHLLGGLAKSQECPPELLELLETRLEGHWLHRLVGTNPACPPAVLNRFVAAPDLGTRQAGAANRACPPDLLERLACDESSWVRAAVASNPACPEPLLERLVAESDREVLTGAAAHPLCPPQVVVALAGAVSWPEREAAAASPACPTEMLERFVHNDPVTMVRQAAAANPACSPDRLGDWCADPDLVEWVAANPACPADVLARLATAEPNEVRRLVAGNPACPSAVLVGLLERSSKVVIAAAAARPQCPSAALRDMPLYRVQRKDMPWVVVKALGACEAAPGVLEVAASLLAGGFDGSPAELLAAARTVRG